MRFMTLQEEHQTLKTDNESLQVGSGSNSSSRMPGITVVLVVTGRMVVVVLVVVVVVGASSGVLAACFLLFVPMGWL